MVHVAALMSHRDVTLLSGRTVQLNSLEQWVVYAGWPEIQRWIWFQDDYAFPLGDDAKQQILSTDWETPV